MSSVRWHFLDLFFYPGSVAVVGATRDKRAFNFNLLANLIRLEFAGKIYPVNPHIPEILGLKTYPDLESIEGDIDLAVVGVPARLTLGIIKKCVARGVKRVVIVPGGFAEIGVKGRQVQDEIRRLLSENGIRATGPNALSPINTANNLAISFYPIEKLTRGELSFIFQSGLYEIRLGWLFSDFNLPLSKLIDLGNKMDISEVDALEYLSQDPDTRVIAMHLESVTGDAREFMQLLRNTSMEKPVIVLKGGRTQAGAKAASSHTGAIISSGDVIFDAVLKQSGAIQAESLEEFFDLAKSFEYLPLPKKNRIVVSSGPGGEAVLATDLCQFSGLTMAQLSPETYNKLRPIFPPWDIPGNPFDTGVCMQFHNTNEVFSVLLDALANDSGVDCLAIQIPMSFILAPSEFAKVASGVAKRGKPLVTWLAEMTGDTIRLARHLELNRIPVFSSAERAIKVLSALYRHNTWREKSSAISSEDRQVIT